MQSSPSPAALSGAQPKSGWLDLLLSTPGVVTFWLLYGVIHATLRLSMSSTLSLDDSRSSEMVQTLSLGYQLRQPPLYEWLLWSLQQLLGTGLISHSLLRYSLIAAIGLSAYVAARAVIKDDRWAAAASLSLLLSYPVGWTFHEWATHTLILSIACFLTLAAALRFLEAASWQRAVLLGVAMGLGLMSKFTYLLFLGGLVLAVLSLPETRRRLLDARLSIALAIALAMAAPYIWWLIEIRGDIIKMGRGHLIHSSDSHAWRALVGFAKLIGSLPLFLLPWLAAVAALAWPAFGRFSLPRSSPTTAERIALRSMLFAIALAAIGVIAVGATNVAERYMHAILMTAPAFVFAFIARRVADGAIPRRITGAVLVVAIVLLGIRFLAFTDNPLSRQAARSFLLPYNGLATALSQRGVGTGTLYSPSVRDGGNMRAFLPDLRVIAGDTTRVHRPPRRPTDEQSCVILWRDADVAAMPTVPRADERIDIVAHGMFTVRHGTWNLTRLDPATSFCR